MLPVFNTHPRGWENPVVARLAATVLGAAWDATPLEFFVSGAQNLTLAFTYTRGAAGGAFDYQIEVSLYAVAANAPTGAAEWITESVYASGAVALGADTQSRVQREYQTYGSQGAAAEDVIYGPIALNGTIERVRVRARESADGVPGTAGTLQISGELF
jgi:hypothetical protein